MTGTHIAEKCEDHQGGQPRPRIPSWTRLFDRAAYVDRLIHDDIEIDARGCPLFSSAARRAYAIDPGDAAGSLLAIHRGHKPAACH